MISLARLSLGGVQPKMDHMPAAMLIEQLKAMRVGSNEACSQTALSREQEAEDWII